MENIWKEAIESVGGGSRFKVDFEGRSLKVDGQFIIENGEYEGDLGLVRVSVEEMLSEIETLYQRYKHSIPSERSQSKRRNYFRALPEQELDDDDMLYGDEREVAQARLELYVLISVLNGTFDVDKVFPAKQWFWQSNVDQDLVILRKWIQNNNN